MTSTVSLAEVLQRRVDRPGMAEMTRHRDRWAMGLILDFWGEDKLAQDVRREEVNEFHSLCAETFTRTTPRIILALLVRALEDAYVRGEIPHLVVVGLLVTRLNGGGSR